MNVIDRILDLSVLWKQVSTVFPYFDKRDPTICFQSS